MSGEYLIRIRESEGNLRKHNKLKKGRNLEKGADQLPEKAEEAEAQIR